MKSPRLISLPESRAGRFALLSAFWIATSAVFVLHAYIVVRVRGLHYRLDTALFGAVTGLIWIPFTPLVTRAVRRFPLEAGVWGRRFLLHFGLSFLLNVIGVAAATEASYLVAPPAATAKVSYGQALIGSLLETFLLYQLIYAAIAAIVHAQRYHKASIEYLQKYRERDLRTATLETQLAQAQLQALRMQLNPHFLFNTLHAVSSLMTQNVRAARRMVADLSELLRLSLDRAGENEVTLQDELHFLHQYLSIEETRFQDRLSIEMEIAPETLEALLPNLLLQPLVENAIKHGIAPFDAGGIVRLESRREGGVLEIHIDDTGPGPISTGGATERKGIGLRNTRERLVQLYGTQATLELRNLDQGGFRVAVRIPFHTAQEEPQPAWTAMPSAY